MQTLMAHTEDLNFGHLILNNKRELIKFGFAQIHPAVPIYFAQEILFLFSLLSKMINN